MLILQDTNTSTLIFEGMKGMPDNSSFTSIHDEFMDRGWFLSKNENNVLKYSKNAGMDEFIIKLNAGSQYEITVPLAGTHVAYRAIFNDYISACDHIYNHLKIYDSKVN